MSGSKAPYFEFCERHYVPIQLQPWWLDAVCSPSGQWEVALAFDRGGAVCGALPYFQTRRWGFRVIQLPPLSAYAGPWLHYPANPDFKKNSRYAFEANTLKQLIIQLPAVDFFHQTFRPEIRNWLPFYWSGFRQTTRYTYLFPDTRNLPDLYAGLKNTVRTDLRKAEAATRITREVAPELVFQLNALSFARKNRSQPYSQTAFFQLHAVLAERRQSICLIARDQLGGVPCAGLYLAYDSRQASVLLAGFDPAYSASRALHGLYWEAIRFCSENSLSLDLEGSMSPGIERAFRGFGGQLTPYFQVWKAGNPLFRLWHPKMQH